MNCIEINLISIIKEAQLEYQDYLDEKDNQVEIIMKNISEAEMNFDGIEITEIFIQGDKARNHEGSGLGLAIVKILRRFKMVNFI